MLCLDHLGRQGSCREVSLVVRLRGVVSSKCTTACPITGQRSQGVLACEYACRQALY